MLVQATFLLCLFVKIGAQFNVITKESSEYSLKVENLGTHLYVQVLYQIEKGVRRCEMMVDEEYIQKNLPFIINLDMLFALFGSEKDYKIKNQGEVVELYTYQTVAGKTYSQVSQIILKEIQIIEKIPKKTTNLSEENKDELQATLRKELMEEMRKEVDARMRKEKEETNKEIEKLRKQIENLRKEGEKSNAAGINQRFDAITNETRNIRNSFSLLQGQFLSEFGKIEKMVSDLKAVVEENKKKAESELKKIEGQQESGSFNPNKVVISTIQKEITTIKGQIKYIVDGIKEQDKAILELKQNTLSQFAKIYSKEQISSIKSPTKQVTNLDLWETGFAFADRFNVRGGIAEYIGSNGQPTQLVMKVILYEKKQVFFICKMQNSGSISFGIMDRFSRKDKRSSCQEVPSCIRQKIDSTGYSSLFKIFRSHGTVYVEQADLKGKVLAKQQYHFYDCFCVSSPYIQMQQKGDKVQCVQV